jgi:hypothetical protein
LLVFPSRGSHGYLLFEIVTVRCPIAATLAAH